MLVDQSWLDRELGGGGEQKISQAIQGSYSVHCIALALQLFHLSLNHHRSTFGGNAYLTVFFVRASKTQKHLNFKWSRFKPFKRCIRMLKWWASCYDMQVFLQAFKKTQGVLYRWLVMILDLIFLYILTPLTSPVLETAVSVFPVCRHASVFRKTSTHQHCNSSDIRSELSAGRSRNEGLGSPILVVTERDYLDVPLEVRITG